MFVPGGALYTLGLEMPLGSPENSKRAMFFQAGGFSYEYSDGDYTEWGGGSLLSAGVKFYAASSTEGMYFGLSLGTVSFSGSYNDWGGSGDFSGDGLIPLANVGYKMKQGTMYIEPNLLLGSLISAFKLSKAGSSSTNKIVSLPNISAMPFLPRVNTASSSL